MDTAGGNELALHKHTRDVYNTWIALLDLYWMTFTSDEFQIAIDSQVYNWLEIATRAITFLM